MDADLFWAICTDRQECIVVYLIMDMVLLISKTNEINKFKQSILYIN